MVSERIRKHIQQNVVGYVALFLVLTSGTAYALKGHNTVFSDDIVKNAVRSSDVRDDTLKKGGLAAKDLRPNSVGRSEVRNDSLPGGGLIARDLHAGSVGSSEVANDSLSGADIDESSLGLVPDADQLDGHDSSAFLSSSVYTTEAPTDTGTLLGDGTEVKSASCNPGDRLLAGGPASVNANSRVLDSFPPNPATWQARIFPVAGGDNFTVVVLCADQ